MPAFGTITANGDAPADGVLIVGPFMFAAVGTWGGGTFTLYYKSRTGAYKALNSTTPLTTDATGQVLYDLPAGVATRVKATLTGSTTPSLAWEFIGDIASD